MDDCKDHHRHQPQQQQQHLDTCHQTEAMRTDSSVFQKVPAVCQAGDTRCSSGQDCHHHHQQQQQQHHLVDDIPHHCRSDVGLRCRGAEASQTSDSHCNVKRNWFYVDRVIVGQLNDVFWLEGCLKALHQLIDHHHQQQQQQHNQLIVLSRTPSMFPIAALRLGLVSHVCFLDLGPVHRPLIGRLLSVNGVGEGHVTYGRSWQRDVMTVLFADIVSSEGRLQQNVIESLTETRCFFLSAVCL